MHHKKGMMIIMEDDERYIENLRLQSRQKQINNMFEEEGLTDEILKEQIELNKRRNELDIHDPNHEVNERFVQ